MIVSPKDWEKTMWAVTVRLDAPDLSPCAVQCAIFDHDPTTGLEQALRTPGAATADRRGGQGRAHAEAWDYLFRTVTGDRLYLLTDFVSRAGLIGTPPRGKTSPEVRVRSSDPEGRRWVATKSIRVGARLVCWCLAFEAKRGHSASVVLRGTNMTDLGAGDEPQL